MAFLTLFLLIIIFSSLLLRKPGAALVVIILFQDIIGLIAREIGLGSMKFPIVVVLFLIYCFTTIIIKRKKVKIDFNAILLGLFALLIGMIIHLFIIGGVEFGGKALVARFLLQNVSLLLIAFIFLTKDQLKDVSYGVLIFGILFYLILFLFGYWKIISVSQRLAIRDFMDISPIAFARINGMVLITSLIYGSKTSRKKIRFLCLTSFILALYWIFVAASRGVIIAIAFTIILFYFFESKDLRTLAFNISPVLLIIPLLYFLLIFYDFAVLERFYQLKSYEEMERYVGYLAAWNLFIDNWILGLGPNGYYELTGRIYPHNFFLELVSEYGLFGFISFSLIVFGGFLSSFKILQSRSSDFRIKILVLFWIFYFVATMFSGYIVSNREFWVSTGILLSVIYFYQNDRLSKLDLSKFQKIIITK